jgi:hypothetical protein
MEVEKILQFVGKIYEEKLNALLATAETINKSEKVPHRSEQINELATALAVAQSQMSVALEDSNNPFHKSKYANLGSIIKASRPYLTKNGLSVTQQVISYDNGSTMLHTILMHNSGQWIESTMRLLPPKPDPQSLGAYITYMRRYSYGALINTYPGKDEDDDAESLMGDYRNSYEKGTALPTPESSTFENYETISRDQHQTIRNALATHPEIGVELLPQLKISSFADLPRHKYQEILDFINLQKSIRPKAK